MSKTINDILPPSRRRTLAEETGAPVMDMAPRDSGAPPMPPRRPLRSDSYEGGGRRFPYGTALVALLVVAGAAAALYAFSAARVEITPASNAVYVSSDFTATAAAGDLPFQTVEADKIAGQNVPAESTETVNDPARGTITITNAQTSAQTLIKNTRFQSASNLIFRIRDSVTVPAATAAGPGSISATVYADAGGDQYNIGPSAFTVPGLKGNKAYALVTAKSSAGMTGGFSGTRPSVSQATRDAQNSANQAALQKTLADALKQKIPAGYIVVPGGTFTTFDAQPLAPGPGGTVTVAEKGTVVAVVFPQTALAKAIAFKSIGTYAGQNVIISDVSGLTMKPAVGVPPVNGEPTFGFTLTGNATITWVIDQAKIAGAVAGKSRDASQNALAAFPEVDRAVLVLRPFWASAFPQDPSRIKVTTVKPR